MRTSMEMVEFELSLQRHARRCTPSEHSNGMKHVTEHASAEEPEKEFRFVRKSSKQADLDGPAMDCSASIRLETVSSRFDWIDCRGDLDLKGFFFLELHLSARVANVKSASCVATQVT